MKICEKCGANVPDSLKACTSCGAKMVENVMQQEMKSDETLPNEAMYLNSGNISNEMVQPSMEKAQSVGEQPKIQEKTSKIKGLLVAIIAIIGIIIIFAESALAGGIVYLVAAGIACLELNKDKTFRWQGFFDYAKLSFAEGILTNKTICVCVIAIAPIIIGIAWYRWIYVEPFQAYEREMDNIMNEYNNLMNEYYYYE